MKTNVIYHHSGTRMKEIDDNSVHLVVTKPRFPMYKKWDRFYKNVDFDKQHAFLKKAWKESYRILVEGGICCIVMSDITRSINKVFQCYPNCSKVTIVCKDIGFNTLIPIICRKPGQPTTNFMGSGFLPPNAYVKQEVGSIIILRKGGLRKFSEKEKVIRQECAYSKTERDTWFQQVWWSIDKHKLNEMSEQIAYKLIRMFSIAEDLIVDPFVEKGNVIGTFSKYLKRNFIGYYSDNTDSKVEMTNLKNQI